MGKKKIIFLEWLIVLGAVFLLYQLVWPFLYNYPRNFFVKHEFWSVTLIYLLFNSIYCAVSLLFAYCCVWFARKMDSVVAKIMWISFGLLIFNFVWSLVFSLVVTAVLFTGAFEIYDPVDTYALAITSTLVLSLLFTGKYVKAFIHEETVKNKERDAAKDATIKSLQLQISPHFLFNNLSVLSSLISEDSEKAEDFLIHLSRFYRHTLTNTSFSLISVEEELAQLDDYIALLRTRFGESVNIRTERELTKNSYTGLISPGTIQMLVENCIKHNRFSKQVPLQIEIICGDGVVKVRNNYRPVKNDIESNCMGHENIMERYRLLDRPDVVIEHDCFTYCVTVPLIFRS